MQHLPIMTVCQRALRAKVCTQCSQRPPHSESWGPAVMRACELECTVFSNLPRLAAIAKRQHGGDSTSLEQAVIETICINCHVTTSAGDYCEKRLTRSCVLSRYGQDAVQGIAPLLRRRRAAAADVPRPIPKAR